MIVSETQSYLSIGLKDKFIEAGYEIVFSKCDITSVSKYGKDVEGIIIYCDDKIMIQDYALNYIKDMTVENDISLFIAGNQEELDKVSRIITRELIAQEFLRPLKIPEVIRDVTEYLTQHGKAGKKKILVVDDSGAMLRNVKAWLEGKYQVILANSGAMAIKYLALNQPDLILLDYEMPVVNGKQVLEMIRGEADFSHIPVIFLTSKGDKESVMEVMDLKPEGYLLKTLAPKEIVKFVDEFFERQKLIAMTKEY